MWFDRKSGGEQMEPVIEHHQARMIAGYSFYGDPTHTHAGWTNENEIGRLWQRFITYCGRPEAKGSEMAQAPVNYEIHLHEEEAERGGDFEVFVGAEISEALSLSPQLCLKVLPEADYAIFTLRGRQIFGGEDCPIDEWLLTSGFRQALPFIVQRYDERFRGLDRIEESELDFLVPVVRVIG